MHEKFFTHNTSNSDHSAKFERFEWRPRRVEGLLCCLVQCHLTVYNEDVVNINLQRIEAPETQNEILWIQGEKNLPTVDLDGGQGLKGDAHHLVEADAGEIGGHALDARAERLWIVQILNLKISHLLQCNVGTSSFLKYLTITSNSKYMALDLLSSAAVASSWSSKEKLNMEMSSFLIFGQIRFATSSLSIVSLKDWFHVEPCRW